MCSSSRSSISASRQCTRNAIVESLSAGRSPGALPSCTKRWTTEKLLNRFLVKVVYKCECAHSHSLIL